MEVVVLVVEVVVAEPMPSADVLQWFLGIAQQSAVVVFFFQFLAVSQESTVASTMEVAIRFSRKVRPSLAGQSVVDSMRPEA
jgi:hypothetical protein